MAELTTPTRREIIQLDELTIGKIAAGEVVERPAQVVKELVENSLDAGAGRIRIEIQRGGFDRITVIDDGHGIHSDELPLAITRHATSKISQPDDLNHIETKGFRGEALASIGAVSQLIVASRLSEEEGYQIILDNGIVGNVEPIALAPGTRIEVLKLFAKVPARLSFQRRPSTETAAIVDVGVQMALCQPSTGLIVEVDGRVVLDCPPAETKEDRLYDLFGATSAELIPLSSPGSDDDAPGDEVGRHPIGVLSLALPTDEVDVNVHPTKREVRLKNSWRVLERLERNIKHTLSKIPTIPELNTETVLEGISSKVEKTNVSIPTSSIPEWATAANENTMVQTRFSSIRSAQSSISNKKPRPISDSQTHQETIPGLDSEPISPALSSQERSLHRHSSDEAKSPLDEPKPKAAVIPELPDMVALAQLADSYILAQGGDELFIVDQHALHERIRYERLRDEMVSWESQQLMAPIEMSLGAREKAAAISGQSRLTELGISFADSNEGISITSVPEVLVGSDGLENFIHDILIEISSTPDGANDLDTVTHLRDHVAFMRSCRGSVKANQRLNLAEMRRLLADMRTVPNPWACVHGRPTVLRLTLNHLDRHFGRHG